MNDDEFEAFVQSANEGRILIGVDTLFARKLFTTVPSSVFQEVVGETPAFQKLVVGFAFFGTPIALLTSVVLAGYAFGWWSIIVIPLAFAWAVLHHDRSVRGGAAIWFSTLLVILAVAVHFLDLLPSRWMSGYFVVFLLALWCNRLVYRASTLFLVGLVLRNRRAFAAFRANITIREVV